MTVSPPSILEREPIAWVETKTVPKKTPSTRLHKPTERDIAEIKRRYASGEYPLKISLDLNVAFDNVKKIIQKKTNTGNKADRNKRIIAMWQAGAEAKDIAGEMEMTPDAVRAVLKRAGIGVAERNEKIRQLYAEGKTQADIGLMYNITATAVNYILNGRKKGAGSHKKD